MLIFNKNHRYLEYKCTRAWLPRSNFWFFEPREEEFDGGGWYVEHNKDGKYSKYRDSSPNKRVQNPDEQTSTAAHITNFDADPNAMNPAVCLLICAFSSLDRMRT